MPLDEEGAKWSWYFAMHSLLGITRLLITAMLFLLASHVSEAIGLQNANILIGL